MTIWSHILYISCKIKPKLVQHRHIRTLCKKKVGTSFEYVQPFQPIVIKLLQCTQLDEDLKKIKWKNSITRIAHNTPQKQNRLNENSIKNIHRIFIIKYLQFFFLINSLKER